MYKLELVTNRGFNGFDVVSGLSFPSCLKQVLLRTELKLHRRV